MTPRNLHGLGWLRGQRLNISLTDDYNTWEALSASECKRLEQQQAVAILAQVLFKA
eukprot:CAMPEP_0185904432 /NCGR_PEP_ID=MMETSP0196C-20130402/3732_1 /TAXON_ID=2932 /ORGANISM="Alexandrium fundyense, Strain CCMP1719" /LENGTH=55 /DNA_ID=CAMNT_0028623743 /DNA_START=18 /DNA_END=181 /DNA_ORIENTATION=+